MELNWSDTQRCIIVAKLAKDARASRNKFTVDSLLETIEFVASKSSEFLTANKDQILDCYYKQ